jgi:hypothetical protein
LVVEDDGAVVAEFEVLAAALDGVLAGADAGGEAVVEGAVLGVWSEVLGTASFFSPTVEAGASSPAVGFNLSE